MTEPILGVDVLKKFEDWTPETLTQALDVDIKLILDPEVDNRRPEGSFRCHRLLCGLDSSEG